MYTTVLCTLEILSTKTKKSSELNTIQPCTIVQYILIHAVLKDHTKCPVQYSSKFPGTVLFECSYTYSTVQYNKVLHKEGCQSASVSMKSIVMSIYSTVYRLYKSCIATTVVWSEKERYHRTETRTRYIHFYLGKVTTLHVESLLNWTWQRSYLLQGN